MDIKLEQYKIFCAAATCGSFSEAAKELFITQSAVSQQIRSLEDELGFLLFVRGKKGAKLTANGNLLYNYAKRAMDELNNAENLFKRMRSLDEGSLRIGSGDTITRHYLLSKLERFHNLYPGVKIEIVNRVTDETLSRLSAGNVDIAFVSMPIKDTYNDFDVIQVGELHDIFIAGNKYSDLCDRVLSMRDIAAQPLVMLEPKSNTRRVTDEYFREHGIELKPEFELGSHDLLFDFALKNLGIACVTEEYMPIDSKDVFKIKTDFQLPARSIGICTLKNAEPAPAVQKLIDMIH